MEVSYGFSLIDGKPCTIQAVQVNTVSYGVLFLLQLQDCPWRRQMWTQIGLRRTDQKYHFEFPKTLFFPALFCALYKWRSAYLNNHVYPDFSNKISC